MSYTEIYKIDKTGDVTCHEDIKNSWRGAMAIWGTLENRYLPPYFYPLLKKIVPRFAVYEPDNNPMREVWDLSKSDIISDADKIVLCTTFNKWIVLKDDFKTVIDAFNSFEGETSLKEQAEVIRSLINDEDCIGVAWNQTSTCSSVWSVYDDEDAEPRLYNIFKDTEHTNLFKEVSSKQ